MMFSIAAIEPFLHHKGGQWHRLCLRRIGLVERQQVQEPAWLLTSRRWPRGQAGAASVAGAPATRRMRCGGLGSPAQAARKRDAPPQAGLGPAPCNGKNARGPRPADAAAGREKGGMAAEVFREHGIGPAGLPVLL